MLNTELAERIREASVSEQIEILELILRSLKSKIEPERKSPRKPVKPFKVRKFKLGEEIHVDREKMYSERGL